MKNKDFIITVDVETDWGGRQSVDEDFGQGINEGLNIILESLDIYHIKGVFFISGELAKEKPWLVEKIKKSDHNIASHGFHHNLHYNSFSLEELNFQLAESKKVLEDITGCPVKGFRTPQFRVHKDLFRTLADLGYTFDSSIVPTKILGRYCYDVKLMKEAKKFDIIELPVGLIPIVKLPLGLLWINALGMNLFKKLISYCELGKSPLVFYCHPFDFVKEKKKYAKAPMLVELWYSFRSKNTVNTLNNLLKWCVENSDWCKSRPLENVT